MRFSSILIILIFVSFGASAQVYQNMAQPGYKFGRARFDSVLTIPTGLGAMRNITGGQDTGQIRFNVSDSSVYVWNGRRWVKPVGGGISDTLKVSVSDTAAMLANYAKTAALALKVNISDTAAMLSPYVRAASLTIPTLTQVLEAAPGSNEAGANQIKDLSAGTSQNDAATFGQLTDTANLRLRISDTSAMLRRYLDTLQAHNTRIISAGGGGGGSTGWALTGNASAVTDFLGTTNNRTMRFRTNNVERMVIDSIGRVGIGTATPTQLLNLQGNSAILLVNTPNTTTSQVRVQSNSANFGSISNFPSTFGFGLANRTGFNSNTSMSLLSNSEGNGSTTTSIEFRPGGYLPSDAIGRATLGGLVLEAGNTTAVAASAILEARSTTKGVLIPRMTLTQRNAIASPAAGLQVIVTGETGGEFVSMYNSSLAAWTSVSDSAIWKNGGTYTGSQVLNLGTFANGYSQTWNKTAIGEVSGFNRDAITLDNTTSAANNAQQHSPALKFRGRGWGTTAGTSQTFDFVLQNSVSQGSVPSGTLQFQTSLNNGTRVTAASLTSTGIFGTTTGNFSGGLSGSGVFGNQVIAGMTGFSGTQYRLINGGTAFTPFLHVTTSGVTAGTLSLGYDLTNQMTFLAANASSTRIARASIGITNLVNTAAAEKGDLIFNTQRTAGLAVSESMRLTADGSLGISGTPVASAILDITSTSKGILFPRMTTVQKLAIGSPAAGLQVYDTTLNQMSYFNGTTWVNF